MSAAISVCSVARVAHSATRLSDLAPACQRLVRLLSDIRFGCVESLMVRRGAPVFDPPPRVVRELRFGVADSADPSARAGDRDFVLKQEIRELLAGLWALGDGVVERLDIRHGLPHRMIVAANLPSEGV
jgi:hypothetical protein